MTGFLTSLDRAPRLRRHLAIILLSLFALQSGLRLIGMLPPFLRMSVQVPLAHTLDLAALVALTILLLRMANGKMRVLVPLGLTLAAIGVVLTAFDVALLIVVEYQQRITTLPAFATFYCNQDAGWACIAPYSAAASIVGAV